MIVRFAALIGAACLLLLPAAASAYIGPGAGASLAGSILGVLAAIVTALAIVLFWPLRLLYKKIKRRRQPVESVEPHEATEETSTGPAE